MPGNCNVFSARPDLRYRSSRTVGSTWNMLVSRAFHLAYLLRQLQLSGAARQDDSRAHRHHQLALVLIERLGTIQRPQYRHFANQRGLGHLTPMVGRYQARNEQLLPRVHLYRGFGTPVVNPGIVVVEPGILNPIFGFNRRSSGDTCKLIAPFSSTTGIMFRRSPNGSNVID